VDKRLKPLLQRLFLSAAYVI